MNITNKKWLLILGVFIVIIVLSGTVFYEKFINQNKASLPRSKELLKHLEAPTSQEIESLTATSSLKTYRNAEWGFKFQYPQNWILREHTFYSPFSKFDLIGAPSEKDYLIYYPAPPFLINIVVPDFVERQFSDLKNIASKTIVEGVVGLKYEYEEEKLSRITIILPFGQYKMILGTEKEYEDVFNQILLTFKFLK